MKVNLKLRLVASMILVVPLFAVIAFGSDSVAATATPVVQLTGVLPTFAQISGTISVFAEPDMSKGIVGESFPLAEIASQSVSGSSFNISIPNSAQVDSLASLVNSPFENVFVQVSNGVQMTSEGEAIPTSQMVATGSGTNAQIAGSTPTISMGTFPAPWSIPTNSALEAPAIKSPNVIINGCTATLKSSKESSTQIGELHTASATVKGVYSYNTNADSNTTIGISLSDGGFSLGGQFSLTNSIGSGGSATAYGTAGMHEFIDSDIYYGTYLVSGNLCGPYYAVQPYDSVGDVFTGADTAAENPWGGCLADPNGHATLDGNGGQYHTQTQQAYDYSAIADVFGFEFGGSTGYETTNIINWTNNGTSLTYACGRSLANSSPILWNNSN